MSNWMKRWSGYIFKYPKQLHINFTDIILFHKKLFWPFVNTILRNRRACCDHISHLVEWIGETNLGCPLWNHVVDPPRFRMRCFFAATARADEFQLIVVAPCDEALCQSSANTVSKCREHVSHWKWFTEAIHVSSVITSFFPPKRYT